MTRTAFVSTYPPQRCGIATFTADLAAAVGSHADRRHPAAGAVRLAPPGGRTVASGVTCRRDYRRAAAWLDGSGSQVVSIQHEYGIWGGPDGAHVLDFVRALRTPVVATLHTVLQHPTAVAAAHPRRAGAVPSRPPS